MKNFYILISLSIILSSCGSNSSQDVSNPNSQIENLENQVTLLQENLYDYESQISELLELINQISINYQESTIENIALINDLQSEINSLQSNIDLITEDLDLFNDEFNATLDEHTSLIAQVESLMSDLSNANASLSELTDLINLNQNSLIGTIAELEFLLETNIQFKQDFSSLKALVTLDLVNELRNGFQVSDKAITLRHPLRATEGLSQTILTTSIDSSNSVEIVAPYHGSFEIDLNVTYTNNGIENIFTKTFKNIYFQAKNYNITWLNATLPVLLFASELMADRYSNGFTYIEIERARTFDFSNLPTNALPFPVYASSTGGNYDNNVSPLNFYTPIDVLQGNGGKAFRWIKEISSINPFSTFSLITVDNNYPALTSFLTLALSNNRYNVIVYSDGTYSTTLVNQIANLDNYQTIDNDFKTWSSLVISNRVAHSYYANNFILSASKLNNFEYIITNKDGWTISQPLIDVIDDYNIFVVSISDLFNKINELGNILSFEFLLKTRWGTNPQDGINYQFDVSPKPNLLILGTSPAGEGNVQYTSFDKYANFVVNRFGNDYDIFFKGHPGWPSENITGRIELFNSLSITELQRTIPVEVLMYLYPNVYVGGYTGTSFQSSLPGQTLFFFGSESFIKGNTVLKSMIENSNVFNNTIFILKDENGNPFTV